MAHLSADAAPLAVRTITPDDGARLADAACNFGDVVMFCLPDDGATVVHRILVSAVASAVSVTAPTATVLVAGNVADLVAVQDALSPLAVRFHLWIAVKRTNPALSPDATQLPQTHFGVLVYTRYTGSLTHTATRQLYTYCPICDRTTKDYGGKKHTYNESGTLLSDVWRDLDADLRGDMTAVFARFADLFGLATYRELLVIDCRDAYGDAGNAMSKETFAPQTNPLPPPVVNKILHGDCLKTLRTLPDNSIDFVFVDPPYNLQKQYTGYGDGLDIEHYFAWCDEWLGELSRVVKPGCTLAVLNLPLWTIRHFLFLQQTLRYQNWIVWDALAFPVRRIMPAHYAVVCFTKGDPRSLPGLIGDAGYEAQASAPRTFDPLRPLAEGYCLRSDCVTKRIRSRANDRTDLGDIWGDIHRLKHSSRRVDHPCQLPPHLMYRLLSLFTRPGETVLDCFNGSGTTTLAAHQMGRDYIGMDASTEYCHLAEMRHAEVAAGIDPFRKEERILSAESKNSPVMRVQKQRYAVSKKVLQLEVRRVAHELGRLPTREEMATTSVHPIAYYDAYFSSWGEVCAAARHAGMSERRSASLQTPLSATQLRLFERSKKYSPTD